MAKRNFLPAIKAGQRVAPWFFRRAIREDLGGEFQQRHRMQTGQDKTGGTLLEEKLLQRGELAQHRVANGIGELAEKTFEALDDVEQHGVVHRVKVIASNMNRTRAICEREEAAAQFGWDDFRGMLVGGMNGQSVLVNRPGTHPA